MDQKSQWFILKVISNQEKKIVHYLETEIKRLQIENFITKVVIPTEKYLEVKDGKKKSKERNFLPGYVLIQAILQPEIIQAISDVPGVIGFLTAKKGELPSPLRQSEVDSILGKVEELKNSDEMMEEPYSEGETVKVIDGQFIGFSGVIQEVSEDKKKLKVLVKMFGRSTPLELNYLQVEREL